MSELTIYITVISNQHFISDYTPFSFKEKKWLDSLYVEKKIKEYYYSRLLIKKSVQQLFNTSFDKIELPFEGKNNRNHLAINEKIREDVFCSLTHCMPYIAFTISECPIGIDIEIKNVRDYLSIAHSQFSKKEIEELQRNENRKELFYRLWTAKESFFKCGAENGIIKFLENEEYCLAVCSTIPNFTFKLVPVDLLK